MGCRRAVCRVDTLCNVCVDTWWVVAAFVCVLTCVEMIIYCARLLSEWVVVTCVMRDKLRFFVCIVCYTYVVCAIRMLFVLTASSRLCAF